MKTANAKVNLIFRTVIVLVALLWPETVFSQSFLEYRDSFNLVDWRFHKGDAHTVERARRLDGPGWEDVNVPHTWNAKDILTEGDNCYTGIGWYRAFFDVPSRKAGDRVFVRFEGVSVVADVFVNGKYVGNHKGAYSAFCFEITPYISRSQSNLIAVKVDNTVQPDVAPSGIDLYPLFGGIYRSVTIFSTNELCIWPLDFASSGVYIRQKQVSQNKADIEVETLLDYTFTPVLQTKSDELLPPKGMQGQGLLGQYFNNRNFAGEPQHTRIDEQVNFYYRMGPAFDDMPSDNFSVLWTGRFVPKNTGRYKFVVASDDGTRLYLEDEMVIDNWGAHGVIEKSYETSLEAGKEVRIKLEYDEYISGASVIFGWMFLEAEKSADVIVNTSVVDIDGNIIAQDKKKVTLTKNQQTECTQNMSIDNPHLWNAKADPYLYTVKVQLQDTHESILDQVAQPLGLRYFEVDRDKGLILNGKPYHLYGVCRHQEWEGLGPALTDAHHEKDIEMIVELGANGVRLAHYQQADKIYSLCDEKGLVVWAEIPNTPAYRAEIPEYIQNTKDQLTELIKQNYNHPSILFWGMYNEIPIPAADVKALHEIAKKLDPYRLTTQADFTQPQERHYETDVAAWNWYFGWYYDRFDRYNTWFDELHTNFPKLKGGLSEYGAGGSISQQKDPPDRPDPTYGRFFAEQYQRQYHEQVWSRIKDRTDIWCKFIWNMFDFSWSVATRGDRDFINHKGLVTHDRKVKKDAFYFYKANWSNEPVLYILSRRYTQRKQSPVPVSVYTNLDQAELYVNGTLISKKQMTSDIHKITWDNVTLSPGRNQISVIGYKGDKKYTDACQWTYSPE